jgi:hypothetical protein
VAESLAHDTAAALDALLIKPPNSLTTAFNRLKLVRPLQSLLPVVSAHWPPISLIRRPR